MVIEQVVYLYIAISLRVITAIGKVGNELRSSPLFSFIAVVDGHQDDIFGAIDFGPDRLSSMRQLFERLQVKRICHCSNHDPVNFLN